VGDLFSPFYHISTQTLPQRLEKFISSALGNVSINSSGTKSDSLYSLY